MFSCVVFIRVLVLWQSTNLPNLHLSTSITFTKYQINQKPSQVVQKNLKFLHNSNNFLVFLQLQTSHSKSSSVPTPTVTFQRWFTPRSSWKSTKNRMKSSTIAVDSTRKDAKPDCLWIRCCRELNSSMFITTNRRWKTWAKFIKISCRFRSFKRQITDFWVWRLLKSNKKNCEKLKK